jgi:predicted nucleic acid-binding protein
MKSVFADTLYWVAIVRPNDPWRQPAQRARKDAGAAQLVTTDEVLSEFLAALSGGGPEIRRRAVATVRQILDSRQVTVVPQSRDSFLAALSRYAAREDKQYSLTDCSSMNAMDAAGIREALTNDHHFSQEGFEVLIRM